MEDKEAIEILTKMIGKYDFSKKEKQAVLAAIGILSWSKLGQGRVRKIIESQKKKRSLDVEDERGNFN